MALTAPAVENDAQEMMPGDPHFPSAEEVFEVDVTANLNEDNPDPEKFAQNLLEYILDCMYRVPQPRSQYDGRTLTSALTKAKEVLSKEPSVIDSPGDVVVAGPLHGQGDSIVHLFRVMGFPRTSRYIFLGDYAGGGFACHEVLFLLLMLKMRYPERIILLRGHAEDLITLKGHEFAAALKRRCRYGQSEAAYAVLKDVFNVIPLAAVVDKKIFCVPGGIGPHLLKEGLARLRMVQRPLKSSQDEKLAAETIWSTLRLTDKFPFSKYSFSEKDAIDFCQRNALKLIIRGRQFVMTGICNRPRCCITIGSANDYLSNADNDGAAIYIGHDCTKMLLRRWRERPPHAKSLDNSRNDRNLNAAPFSQPNEEEVTAPPEILPA